MNKKDNELYLQYTSTGMSELYEPEQTYSMQAAITINPPLPVWTIASQVQ